MTTKGAGALLKAPPVVTIAGNKYSLRRLGLIDIEKMIRIVEKVVEVGGRQKVDFKNLNSEDGVRFLLDFLPYAFDETVEFLADVIGLKSGYPVKEAEKRRKKSKTDKDSNEGTIRDPNVFPLGSEIRLIEALSKHPDVLSFFTEGRALMGSEIVTKLKGLSSDQSTDSSTDTDGATNTSPGKD